MGNEVETKKKKKKGRPSLLDIQKRSLRLQKQQQQEEEQQQLPQKRKRNPNPYTNPNFTSPNSDDDDDDEDDDEQRREKKFKLVLRLPPNQSNSTPYLKSLSPGSDFDENGEQLELKKRKIDGSDYGEGKKDEKHKFASKATGTAVESGPTTPLPDKKLLVFILDRLQKKDTYGVFSDPVDPEELPDYHDIIQHPMDFGTVRKKLDTGAYANLEQFENDVFLISSNAMQYNSPDTIYFRQARSIQELAKKNFENLRQDSDDNESEPKVVPEPKVVRRGRPPTKHLKKSMGKVSSVLTSNATIATRGGTTTWSNAYSLRKGPLSDKYGSNDASKRTYFGSRNSEVYGRWSAEQKFGRNDDLNGSSLKLGKRQFVPEESRRDTYSNPHPSVLGSEPSVLSTFDGEQKQLLPVGLHTEHGYARSLARFAANLGPVAWRVASKKIERVLPPGMKFGPGWVGETETPVQEPPTLAPTPSQLPPAQQSVPSFGTLSSSAMPLIESKVDGLLENQESFSNDPISDCLSSRILHPAIVTSPAAVLNRSLEFATTERVEADRGLSNDSRLCSMGSSGGIRPPIRIHESHAFDPTLNGFSGGFGFSNPSQMGRPVRPGWSAGSFSSEPSIHSRIFDMVSKSNFVNSMPANRLEFANSNLSGNSSNLYSVNSLPNSIEAQVGSVAGLQSWEGLSSQQKLDSVAPDLNLRFQPSGSPSSSVRVDSPHPDLALQL